MLKPYKPITLKPITLKENTTGSKKLLEYSDLRMENLPQEVAEVIHKLGIFSRKRAKVESAGFKTRYYIALIQKGLYGTQLQSLVREKIFSSILTMSNDDSLWVGFEVRS